MQIAIRNIMKVIYLLMIPLAFVAGGAIIGQRQGEQMLESLAEMLEYNTSIYNAAHFGELLMYARKGDSASLISRLEHFSDASLLMAASNTNALVQAAPKGPWQELRLDRDKYPRPFTGERGDRINRFLDELTGKEPQQNKD